MTYANTVSRIFVGVDISKKYLDVHLNPLQQSFRVENTEKGITQLIAKIKPHDVGQVVCESTGGYGHLMLKMLDAEGYETWQVDPNRMKSFIRSEGKRAKNDRIDADMIAKFASLKKNENPRIEGRYDKQALELRDLVACRKNLSDILTEEKLRLDVPQPNQCKRIIERHKIFLEKELAKLDQRISTLIDKDNAFSQKAKIAESIPGIGRTTAATLIAYLPELGLVENKKIAALVGVAPYVNQSGQFVGKASIGGGRFEPRRALYMAAMAAIVHNPKMKAFYQRLKAAGKKPKVVLVAVMRKLIVILNTMLRKGEMWCPSK